MRTALILSVLALATASCGDPLVFAEVDEPRLCIQLHGQAMPAAGVVVNGKLFEDDLHIGDFVPALDSSGTTVTAEVLEFTVTDTSGTADLSGIQSANVTAVKVSSTGAQSDPVKLLDYTRPTPAPKDHITMVGQSVDVGSYLASGNLHYSVSIAGSPPANAWTADMNVCLHVKVMVDALKAAGK
jgi:hypothetical protein